MATDRPLADQLMMHALQLSGLSPSDAVAALMRAAATLLERTVGTEETVRLMNDMVAAATAQFRAQQDGATATKH